MNTRSTALRNTMFSTVGTIPSTCSAYSPRSSSPAIRARRFRHPADHLARRHGRGDDQRRHRERGDQVRRRVARWRTRADRGDDRLPAPRAALSSCSPCWSSAACSRWPAITQPDFNHLVLYGFFVLATKRAQYMFNVGTPRASRTPRDRHRRLRDAAQPADGRGGVVARCRIGHCWWCSCCRHVFHGMSRARTRPLIRRRPARAAGVELRPRLRRHMRRSRPSPSASSSPVTSRCSSSPCSPTPPRPAIVAYQLAAGAATLVPGVIGVLLPMMAGALSWARHRRTPVARPATAAAGGAAGRVRRGVQRADHPADVRIRLHAGDPVFAPCLAVCALAAVSQGLEPVVSADRQGTVLVIAAAGGVLKIVLDVWLIHARGLAGAIAAYLVVGIVSAAAYILVAMRTVGRVWRARLLRILVAAGSRRRSAAVARPPVAVADFARCRTADGRRPCAAERRLRCWSRGDIEHLLLLHQAAHAAVRARSPACWPGRAPAGAGDRRERPYEPPFRHVLFPLYEAGCTGAAPCVISPKPSATSGGRPTSWRRCAGRSLPACSPIAGQVPYYRRRWKELGPSPATSATR